jgi:hypothetical protein
VIDSHDDSYCSRCGGETCLDNEGRSTCDSLELFVEVTTLTALDGPAGQTLFRFKRYGNPGDSIRFVTGLLPLLVQTVERAVVQHEVSCIVVLPFSRQSFMSGKMHPNLVIFDSLEAPFSEQTTAMFLWCAACMVAKADRCSEGGIFIDLRGSVPEARTQEASDRVLLFKRRGTWTECAG